MIIDEWWVYVGIAVWAVVLDSATLLSASATFRFFLVPAGIAYLLIRSVAALVAGLIMPVMVTENLRLDDFPAIVVFLAPLVTVAALEWLLGRVGSTATNEQTNLVSLLADLRRTTVAEGRRRANEVKQSVDVYTARDLSERFSSQVLRRMLLDLLHTKMPSIAGARTRLGLLTAGMIEDDELALRQELATELVKIDRVFARAILGRRPSQVTARVNGTLE